MFELPNIAATEIISLAIKIPLLILLFLFFIFTVIIVSRVRTLNQAVHIHSARASSLILTLAVLYSIAALSLFFLSLVIV